MANANKKYGSSKKQNQQKRGKQQEKYLNVDKTKKRRQRWTIKGADDQLPMFV